MHENEEGFLLITISSSSSHGLCFRWKDERPLHGHSRHGLRPLPGPVLQQRVPPQLLQQLHHLPDLWVSCRAVVSQYEFGGQSICVGFLTLTCSSKADVKAVAMSKDWVGILVAATSRLLLLELLINCCFYRRTPSNWFCFFLTSCPSLALCSVVALGKGSVELKKCEKTSDRLCMCRAGYMPVAGHKLGSGELVTCRTLQTLPSASNEVVVISGVKAVVICLLDISTQAL